MIKIENTIIHGWEAAVRGMRNPMNSWDKSDSVYEPELQIGPNDLKLMQNLSSAGNDHGKFLRFIDVTVDVDAPIYFWKEFETYRTGVAPHPTEIELNSCSTMHKIHAEPFNIDHFSHDHLRSMSLEFMDSVIKILNIYRSQFIATKDKAYWWQIIQLLPSSYNQRRTMHLNYAALKNMYHARKNHKLDEWRELCAWIESLPYAKELICDAR